MPRVAVRDTGPDLVEDVAAVFRPFGGAGRIIAGRDVIVKPNAVHYLPGQSTATELLDALLQHLRTEGARRIFLADNSTAGNLTRVVFRVLGWDRLARKYGAEPVYLDEEPTRPVFLQDETSPVRIPRFLHQRLLEKPERNFYLSVPRLKTHSMSHVTLGIKNQQGLLIHPDRLLDHNYNLGRRLVRILHRFRPDFTLVEGITATIRGHFPIKADLAKSIINTRVLFGGPDVVAVDAVGASILGYRPDEVDHIRRAAEAGLGTADLDRIRVLGSLERFRERYPYLPDIRIPPDINMVYGKQRACYEGCRGNTEIAIHLFANDYAGKGGFNVVMGKGVDLSELEGLEGPFLVVGPCAVAETADKLKAMYPARKLYLINEHNDLANVSGALLRLMRPKISGLLPLSLPETAALTARAYLRGTTARLINPF
ncbi:MAG: DUF362 domain-containing protein [bacterium]